MAKYSVVSIQTDHVTVSIVDQFFSIFQTSYLDGKSA